MSLKERAPVIGLTLGTIFIIIGFIYGNSGLWMLGLIILAVGLFAKYRKG